MKHAVNRFEKIRSWVSLNISAWLIAAIALALIWIHLLTLNDYLFFHCIVEVFAVVVAWGIFIFAMHTGKFMKKGYFPILGIGFLFVGFGDLLHALAYEGMTVFSISSGPNLATQLWIAARFLQAASFGVASLFLWRKTQTLPVFVGFAAVATILFLSILRWNIFPVCYTSEAGLTAFKIASEYVICLILIAACGHLYINRNAFHSQVFGWLLCSLLLTIFSEMAFSFYGDPTSALILIGHVFKVTAFIAVYKAIIQKGLVEPHKLIFHDLEKREEFLENSLHKSNAILERVFDNTHMLIAYLDRDLNFVRVNRAYAKACQHEPKFLVGKNHFELCPHPENEAIFRRVIETGKPCIIDEKPFIFPVHSALDTTYWDWNLRPLFGEDKRVENLLFCLINVTERVNARQKLNQSEQKYRELVESVNNVIMRVSPKEGITFFNEYAQKFFGYSSKEILGKSVLETIVPETDINGRNLRELVGAITANPDNYRSQENENICKDGRRVWMHWSNRVILESDGQVKEVLCVGTDITQRKKLEIKTALYRKRLQKLADRLASTEELERRRISSQIHDTVIQTLSLINIRLGGVKAAVKSAGLDKQLDTIDTIRELLDGGIGECRNLMASLTPPLLYEIGLAAALKDFAANQNEIHGSSISIEDDGKSGNMTDELRGFLFQAARELVINAMKHANGGEIVISIARKDKTFRVQVRDTGPGFNPENLDEQHLENFQNGGYGLFNLRERLQSFGGQLDIDSAPGKSTTITIDLPVPKQVKPTQHKQNEKMIQNETKTSR